MINLKKKKLLAAHHKCKWTKFFFLKKRKPRNKKCLPKKDMQSAFAATGKEKAVDREKTPDIWPMSQNN